MLYTQMTKKAMRTAYAAHHGQTDKSGVPYIFHPLHLAEQMESEEAVVVALLHDVVEDTAVTLEDLRAEGFSEDVLRAIRLLTRKEGVPYLEYVAGIRGNALARVVKLADLAHNSDMTRLDQVTDKALKRVKKYEQAIRLLNEV